MALTKRMTGGEAMLQAAVANGVDTVFGLPGAQIYPLFDAMYRTDSVQAIISRHEQGAAYMANGYSAATGKPGVFAVVPGPGVLNASAALCTAVAGNLPVLCLTGQVMSEFLGKGRGHLHELDDQRATLASIIKAAERIDDPAATYRQVNGAFRQMLSGRQGPVSLEMCWDTMARDWDVAIEPGNEAIDRPSIDEDAINEVADLIADARNIMIMCGSGARHASAEVHELAEMLGACVTSLRSGRGVVSEDSAWGASSVAAHSLWPETDLLIGIGSRLELQFMRWLSTTEYYDRPPPGSPTVVRIDIDPDEMERFKPDVGVVADSAEATRLLIEKVRARGFKRGDADRIATAKAAARRRIEKDAQPQLAYLDVIRAVLPRDGYFVEELCQVGFVSQFGFEMYEPRTYVTTTYQGTLGFGFPTAIGVKAAVPDRAVVSVIGDGGFMYGLPELACAAQHGIGLVTIVFNNSSFGNVRRDQLEKFAGNVIGSDLDNPDFVKLTESFGVDAHRVDSPAALKPVLEQALANDRPAVIEVPVERGSEASPWQFLNPADHARAQESE
ncbi:MAG: thiamine pyrophosphate-dependent enzyme [Pseudomonadota bacterium]